MRTRVRTAAAVLLAFACALVSFLLLGGTASAATAPGSEVFTWAAAPTWHLSVSCTAADCVGGSMTVTETSPSGDAVTALYAGTTTKDPRTLACWSTGCTRADLTALPNYVEHTIAQSGTNWTGTYSDWRPDSTRRYLLTSYSGPITLWDFGAPATTTTPAPTSSTSTPSTSSAPGGSDPSSTSSAPSTAPGGSGSTLSCTTESPCVVTLADGQAINLDASGLTVQALTDDQWKEILLGMGSLVFFAAAAFVSSWRGGRSR